MALNPAVINDEDSTAPPRPRPRWRTLESVYDTGFEESRATLLVINDAGLSCMKGAIRLQRYDDTILFRLAYEGYDAPHRKINFDKTRKGCVYLPADDLVNWDFEITVEEKDSGFDVQTIRMRFPHSSVCGDGPLTITITIILSDDNDERFSAALLSAKEERSSV
jgi:hypothetical protein